MKKLMELLFGSRSKTNLDYIISPEREVYRRRNSLLAGVPVRRAS